MKALMVVKTFVVALVMALALTSVVLPAASAAEAEGVSYTLLEWIRTTPSRTFAQYIDTGVYPDVGIETHFVFKREENCPEQRFFGVQYWGNVGSQVYYSFNFGPDWGTTMLGMLYFKSQVFSSRQGFAGLNVKEKTTIDFSDELYLNGVSVWTNNFENVDFSGSQHQHLRIGSDTNDSKTQITVYECRISKGGVDLCDLWPCKKVDAGGNEWYGVYDFANQKFIGNSAAPNDVTKTYVGGPADEKFKIKYRKSSGRYERVPVTKGFCVMIF